MRTNTKNQDMNELRFAQSYADWRPSGRRLAVALSLSAVFVAMFLSLVTLPHWDWAPAAEDPVFELVIVQPEEAIVPAPGRSAVRVAAGQSGPAPGQSEPAEDHRGLVDGERELS